MAALATQRMIDAPSQTEQGHLERVENQGYQPLRKSRKSYCGKTVDEVKYVKDSEDTVGKIPKAIAYGFLGVLGTIPYLITKAVGADSWANTIWDGTWKEVKTTIDSDEDLIGMRTVRATVGFFGTVATFGIAPLVDKAVEAATGESYFLDPFVRSPASGKLEKTLYFETDEEEDIAHLGYNPKSTESVAAYVRSAINGTQQRHKGEDVRVINGNYVLVDGDRFLLIPGGDYTKACAIKFWNAKTGEPFKSEESKLRAINTLLASRADIDQEFEKKADDEARKVAKVEGRENDQAYIKQLRDGLKRTYHQKSIKISAKNNMWCLASDDMNNPDKNSGVWGSFGKETKKELDVIHNRNMMEHKGKLGGSQPFRKRPKASNEEIALTDLLRQS